MSATDEKLQQLIQKLKAKSESGEVSWEQDGGDESQFLASFPGHSVGIRIAERRGASPVYTFTIFDGAGAKLESLTVDDTEYYSIFWPEAYKDISILFSEARRKAFNVGQALDEILKVL